MHIKHGDLLYYFLLLAFLFAGPWFLLAGLILNRAKKTWLGSELLEWRQMRREPHNLLNEQE